MEISDSENITSDNISLKITTINNYNHNDKKILVKRIGDIKNKKCYIKIFKLIHGDNLSYTKNDNGIFFNLNNLSNELLTNIEYIIQYYEQLANI
jgi:hypothetical protein